MLEVELQYTEQLRRHYLEKRFVGWELDLHVFVSMRLPIIVALSLDAKDDRIKLQLLLFVVSWNNQSVRFEANGP